MDKKKVIIIGAGIAGLTTGIYALDNGYDVSIYEKHSIVGGQCTGWNRQGVYIDGCAHWIVGTNPNSDLYPLWKHIGAFNENSIIHDTEYFCKYDVDGEVVTFYSNLDELQNEFIRVAPEDEKRIKKFIRVIKVYKNAKVPTLKPSDGMNIFELIAFGVPMVPLLPYLLKYMHMSNKEYASKFKSPILRKVFHRIISDDYNIHSLFYIMQALANNNAGVVEGGSRQLAFNVRNTYINNGGKLYVNKDVDHVLIENNKATGIVLKDGSIIKADYVVAATDAHHIIYDLLQGKYKDNYYEDRFSNMEDNPLVTGIMLSYKVTCNVNNRPKMENFAIKPIKLADDTIIDNVTVRNHAFNKSQTQIGTTFTVLIDTNDGVYSYLKTLSKEDYNKYKNDLGEEIRNYISMYMHIDLNDITLIDVTTPLTYERYTNAYRGSYMSFLTTKKVKGLMRKGLIKGLDNFAMAGQWIMPPGGLPIALFSGKHAAYRICKMDRKHFVNNDNSFIIARKRISTN